MTTTDDAIPAANFHSKIVCHHELILRLLHQIIWIDSSGKGVLYFYLIRYLNAGEYPKLSEASNYLSILLPSEIQSDRE
jgi:hypothetical protein